MNKESRFFIEKPQEEHSISEKLKTTIQYNALLPPERKVWCLVDKSRWARHHDHQLSILTPLNKVALEIISKMVCITQKTIKLGQKCLRKLTGKHTSVQVFVLCWDYREKHGRSRKPNVFRSRVRDFVVTFGFLNMIRVFEFI